MEAAGKQSLFLVMAWNESALGCTYFYLLSMFSDNEYMQTPAYLSEFSAKKKWLFFPAICKGNMERCFLVLSLLSQKESVFFVIFHKRALKRHPTPQSASSDTSTLLVLELLEWIVSKGRPS